MNALERLKLIKRLRELRIEADGLGAGGAAAMRKLKIAKETREIRQRLGLGASKPAPDEMPAQGVSAPSAADGFPGRIASEQAMDVPAGWVVMNAPRPLVGTKVLEGGPFLSGRFYAAIDPADSMAANYLDTNRRLDAVVVIHATREQQVEMALIGNEYAEQYRAEYQGDALYEVLSPLDKLSGKTAGELKALLSQVQAGAAAPGPVPTPAAENPNVKTLRDVAKGLHDGDGLDGMFGLIQEAVNAIDEAGQLEGSSEAAAHDAITHWAEMEERLNG